MSIPGNRSKVCYVGNGASTDFDIPFRIWEPTQVKVLMSDAGGERDVTADVRIDVGATGASVHFANPPAQNAAIAILRAMPFTQTDTYTQGSRFNPAELEDRLDQDCAERQQLYEELARAVKVPATSSITPEEYQRQYFDAIENTKTGALEQLRQASDRALAEIVDNREATRQMQLAAAGSEEEAKRTLGRIQDLAANEIAQALNAAASAKSFAADVVGSIEEAAEKAAACIVVRMESYALVCQQMAASAAQSSCEAAARGEQTWLMVREMTAQAGREAAACVIDTCEMQAAIATSGSKSAAASANSAAWYAANMAAIIHDKALEAAQNAASDVADCLENICVISSEICQENANATAANVSQCNAIAADMQKRLLVAANEAALKAAEEVAICCQETCNACVELAITHANASAANARLAFGYAQMAKQTDICLEAETRRAKDEELEKKILEVGENCCGEAIKIANAAMEVAKVVDGLARETAEISNSARQTADDALAGANLAQQLASVLP